jgi:hypothetical protein
VAAWSNAVRPIQSFADLSAPKSISSEIAGPFSWRAIHINGVKPRLAVHPGSIVCGGQLVVVGP